MSECTRCGALERTKEDLLTGEITDQDGQVKIFCNECRAEILEKRTRLSDREAEVAALKQLRGSSHDSISNCLDIEKSTVDEYSRRIAQKLEMAQSTVDELRDLQ